MIRVALPFGIRTPEEKRASYRDALRQAGIDPVENVTDLSGVDGLLLAGGSDVDPALYGAAREPGTDEPERVRDSLEGALLDEALERDLPVLGICRGLQFLNVHLGGTLRQHIEGHKFPKVREVHGIAIAPGSRLEAILEMREYVVNSRHHKVADRIAASLLVTAVAPDGAVEAWNSPPSALCWLCSGTPKRAPTARTPGCSKRFERRSARPVDDADRDQVRSLTVAVRCSARNRARQQADPPTPPAAQSWDRPWSRGAREGSSPEARPGSGTAPQPRRPPARRC
jgi:hypothetical protein